jgi:predicted CoA-binding protein
MTARKKKMSPSDRTPEQVMAEELVVRRRYHRERTNASAILAVLREAGFAVVPVEPTDKMVEAMRAEAFLPLARQNTRAVWRAAVAANEEGTDG